MPNLPNSKALTLSVLIPTWGRSKEVIQTISSLMSQTRLPDEIVVVDQNQPSFPDVDRELARFSRVRHIHASTRGLVRNYNHALTEARGDIVLYLDDDIIPDPKLIEKHLSFYENTADRSLGGVAGRVIEASGGLSPSRKCKVGFYSRWMGSVFGNFDVAAARPSVHFATGGNMSFWRSVLLEVGGFDLGFEGNAYFFEPDAGLRVLEAGYTIHFAPEASLIHLKAPSGGARITDKSVHTFYFIKNGIRLYRRHSPCIGQPFFAAKMVAYCFAKAVYNMQCRIFLKGVLAVWEGWRKPLQLQTGNNVP